nr:CrcB family protein [uncultured Haemophilus sp.]
MNILFISAGAVAGAIARWLLGIWLNPLFTTFAFGTLIANWAGCLLIGVAMELTLHDQQKLLIITGFLGSFTTFSSFSAELSDKILMGKYLDFALTLGLHLVGGILLTLVGIVVTRMIVNGG